LTAARVCCERAAATAGCAVEEVLPFSTGVIGEDLPVERLTAALPMLLDQLGPDRWVDAGWGILTTDTRPKIAARRFRVDGIDYRLAGIAKGAGMLRPDMATMLAFLATDAPVAPALLDSLLRRAVDLSFHRISVDGDTSTNDAVLLAATGAAGGKPAEHESEALATALARNLESLCLELAQGLVRDGEGASKFVEIAVSGGASQKECLDVAFILAHSPLVKTALFAGDPNWGRVLAAIGRAGIPDLDVSGVRILINEQVIARDGGRAPEYDERRAAAAMAEGELRLGVELNRGDCAETVWTSDLSYDYVRINAEYRS
jgi:glutamate N-acetyltransferase/amino-acid N-acetyltransferase